MIGVMTYNVGGRIPSEDVSRWFRDNIDGSVHIAALQESMKWIDEFLKAAPHHRLAIGGTDPIFYDPRHVKLLKTATAPLTDSAFVGREGAGPSTLREKELTAAKFMHKSNRRRFWVGNLHAAPSIHVPEQPGAEVSRDELHEEQMGDAAAFFKKWSRKWLPCVLLGDFNAEFGHSNLRPIRDAGFRLANPDGPTHGRRQIDLILVKNKISPVRGGRVIPGVKREDHDAVFRTLKFA